MAINFPSSPTTNQIYSPMPGLKYKWSGTVWEAVPYEGTALPYNYMINPSFEISQEWGNVALTGNGQFFADQWQIQCNVPAMPSFQSVVGTSPNGSRNYAQMTINAALATPTTDQYTGFVQYMEGVRVAANNFGNAKATPMVLRFWVNASIAGTFGGGFRNGDYTRGLSFSYTITTGQRNTWVEKVIPVTPDFSGTWSKYRDGGLHVWFTFSCHASLATAPGTWVSANIIAPTGMTNGGATSGNTFKIADVGLYHDPLNTGLAPKWRATPEEIAMRESQMYWWRCRHVVGASAGPWLARGRALCPTPMRTNPTMSVVPGNELLAWNAYASAALNGTIGNYSQPHVIEGDFQTVGDFNPWVGKPSFFLNEYPGSLAVSARL